MLELLKILKLDNIFNSLTGYVETKIDYYKIQFKEEVSRALGLLIFIYLFSLILVLFLIFFSFFAVAVINHLMESQYMGFLIVAGIYLILAAFLYAYREKLILSKVMKEIFKETEKDKNKKAHG